MKELDTVANYKSLVSFQALLGKGARSVFHEGIQNSERNNDIISIKSTDFPAEM